LRIVFLFFSLLIFSFLSAQEKRYTFTRQKMGSPFHVIFFCKDSIQANEAAGGSFLLVDSLNKIFSDYISDSELNLLCATAGIDSFVFVSSPLFEIFLLADEAWKLSHGRFDITVGPLSRVWRQARKEKIFPHPDTIFQAKQKVGWNNVIIDKENQRVKLLQKKMQLDLGGIAAGYIAQKVADFLKTQNITSALVDASGDIVCTNAPPG
jgi:thiamine biosynthesis lipoprotein